MSGHGHDLVPREAGLLRDAGRERAEDGAGRHDLGQEVRGDAEAVEERPRPVARPGVEALARGRLGVLGHDAAAEEVVEEVRHHQQPVRLRQQGVPARTSLSSWKSVLMDISWMPVAA